MTLVRAVAAPDEFLRLSELFAALGFEAGKGWQDAGSTGAAFLAPLGNLELVSGDQPATPELLIEVTELDHIHAAVKRWISASFHTEDTASRVSEVAPTHWNSRLFTAQLADGLSVAFWQFEDPFHGVIPAVEGSLSAAGMRFAIVSTRWNTVITDRPPPGILGLPASQRRRYAKDITVVRVPGAWEVPNAARHPRGIRSPRCHHHPGLSAPGRNGALRSHLQRGRPRDWPVPAGDWNPPRLRGSHLRNSRAGPRSGRPQSWKQGL